MPDDGEAIERKLIGEVNRVLRECESRANARCAV
jgi:hypothetical protein